MPGAGHPLAWLDAAGLRKHLHRDGRHRAGNVPLLSGSTAGARVRSTPLSDLYVAKTVKDTAAEAGQPPEVVDTLAGHSLRAGFATAAEAAGVARDVISRIMGHHTGVTGRYIRHTFDGAAQQAVYEHALTVLRPR
ncbi:hypothetical protein [Micromonospora sp. NPDC004551]|uniref:hypothetical protein n=1 Tax=Micromonospora sp. NPDC004551 TaxID=3154284 RepID=UPI0033B115F3